MECTCCLPYREIESTNLRVGSDWLRPASSAKGQHTLFHFMCRWSCSRCWKSAIALSRIRKELVDHHIAVVLVGTCHYLRPATNLAASLKLPFTLLGDDTGALIRAYGLANDERVSHQSAVVLVDDSGLIRFRQLAVDNEIIDRESGLFTAIKSLRPVDLKSAG